MLANFRRPASSAFGLFTQSEVREVVHEATPVCEAHCLSVFAWLVDPAVGATALEDLCGPLRGCGCQGGHSSLTFESASFGPETRGSERHPRGRDLLRLRRARSEPLQRERPKLHQMNMKVKKLVHASFDCVVDEAGKVAASRPAASSKYLYCQHLRQN